MVTKTQEKETLAVDRVSEIAEQEIARLEAEKKAAETKGAAAGASTESQKTKEEIEQQAKDDETILSAKEEELTEEQKGRKAEILKAKEAKESPEERIKRIQESTQKRIDELVGELKAERNQRVQDSERVKSLEEEIQKLRKAEQPSVDEVIVKQEQERIAKYVQEDVAKPKAERREMSKEDMDEFYLEDPVAFAEWLQSRSIRRAEEKQADRQKVQSKSQADEFVKKQQASVNKLMAKFPGTNQRIRGEELSKQGKTPEEINNILSQENAEYKLMLDVLKDNPQFKDAENGPELVMTEMEKRQSSLKKTYTEEDIKKAREEAVEMERKRLANLDTGLTSSAGKGTSVSGSPEYQEGLRLFQLAGKREGKNWTKDDYDKTLAYGKEQRGRVPGRD